MRAIVQASGCLHAATEIGQIHPMSVPALNPVTLAYASALSPRSEYQIALESYRGAWLRHRFLWFCGVGVTLGLLINAVGWPELLAARGPARWALIVSAVQTSLSLLFSVAAFVYAWRSPPRASVILRLAMLLMVLDTTLAVIAARIETGLELAAGDPTALTPAEFWAGVFPSALFLGHLVACVLIPWTVGESLRPVAVNLAIYAVFVVVDLWLLSSAPVPAYAVAMILAAPLAALPGTMICLWRSWRFHRRFRLEFESTGYRRLQGELVSARRLHEAALPPQRTDGAIRLAYAYEPAEQIGGDMLFVHPSDPASECVTAVIFDVTGHASDRRWRPIDCWVNLSG